MKILRMIVLIALVILMGQAAWAQCPSAMGTWTTEDGTMLPGRLSGSPLWSQYRGRLQHLLHRAQHRLRRGYRGLQLGLRESPLQVD